jgi:predicted O-linked N-acetylglucosamine transferase (SPINDLY family)
MRDESSFGPLTEDTLARIAALIGQGSHATALQLSEELVRAAPRDARVGYVHGMALLCAGKPDIARQALEASARLDETVWEIQYLLGRVQAMLGDHPAAEAAYRRALDLSPSASQVHVSLGIVLRARGRTHEAIDCYRRALELDSSSAEARNNLANALRDAGRIEEARECLTAAAAYRHAEAQNATQEAQVLRAKGERAAALTALERAASLAPELAAAHHNLGVFLVESGQPDRAMPHLRQAYDLQPESVPVAANLAAVLASLGEVEEADLLLERCIEMSPDDGRVRMCHATLVPAILDSVPSMHVWRGRFRARVQQMVQRPARAPASRVLAFPTSFFLSYHGEDNRPLLELQSQAVLAAAPELRWEAPHVRKGPRDRGPHRVGFISKHMYSHSIGRTTCGLIAELSRDAFRTYALFVPPVRDDEVSRFVRERSDEWVVLSGDIEVAMRQVADLELDVLFYQDIGMEPFTYCLAHARLAPVQCLSFGHPETSGIATMDYFVSSSLFETPGSEAHYTERLHCIEGVGTLAYYYRPALRVAAKTRAHYGFGTQDHVYLCPQALFKVHPDLDPLIGEILRLDPVGRIVFVSAGYQGWQERLRARLASRIGRTAERIQFLPRQSSEDFINLIAVSDVMLDTVHFNGMNTSLEAFAVGTPVVTLPGRFQRGRHTAAMYGRMGIEELVARDPEDYVRTAVRLGTEPEVRKQVSRRILERSHVLYEDRAVVVGFEHFFREACAAARRSVSMTPSRRADVS